MGTLDACLLWLHSKEGQVMMTSLTLGGMMVGPKTKMRVGAHYTPVTVATRPIEANSTPS